MVRRRTTGRSRVFLKRALSKKDLSAVAMLMVMSLIAFQILVIILHRYFGFPSIELGSTLSLIVIGAAIILPFSIITGEFKPQVWPLLLLLAVLAGDLIFLIWVAPAYFPQFFTLIPMVIP